jgi:hypothetical protein
MARYFMTQHEPREFAINLLRKGEPPCVVARKINERFGAHVTPKNISRFRCRWLPNMSSRAVFNLKMAEAMATDVPEPTPTKTEIQFAEWTIRKKSWPVKRLDQNGVPSGYVDISLAAGMVPA